jgi:aralkylamine N-acetyltransferase
MENLLIVDYFLPPIKNKKTMSKQAKPFSKEITIAKIDSAEPEQLKALYIGAGWLEASDSQNPEFLNHIVQDSAVFIGAFHKKKLIGMGRALSDLSSDAYIQDVTVLKNYRKKGVGKKIICALLAELKKNKVDWIGLIAEPGAAPFFKALGFQELAGHTPLKYNNKDI